MYFWNFAKLICKKVGSLFWIDNTKKKEQMIKKELLKIISRIFNVIEACIY